jgi:protein-S-isoprenylcysteine O-methyltransferase Ste14
MTEIIFKVFYVVGMIAGREILKLTVRRHKRSKVIDDRTSRFDRAFRYIPFVGMVVIPLIYILTPFLGFADYHLPDWAGWTGMLLFAAALWLLWRAHADLGSNWSLTLQVRREQEVIRRGVYRYIRHPIYAAVLVWGIAQALLLHNWIAGFARLAFFVPVFVSRVPREEAMMLDHFGDEYRSYMKQTGRMFPRFRRLFKGGDSIPSVPPERGG